MMISTFPVSFNETRGLSGPLMGWLPRCKIFGHKNVSLCWGATSSHLLCLHAPWQPSTTGSSQAPGLFAAARHARLTERNLTPGTAPRAPSGRPPSSRLRCWGTRALGAAGTGQQAARQTLPAGAGPLFPLLFLTVRLVSCSPRISGFPEKRKKLQ